MGEKKPANDEIRWKGTVITTRDPETITRSIQFDITYPKKSKVTHQLIDLFVEFLVERHEQKKADGENR